MANPILTLGGAMLLAIGGIVLLAVAASSGSNVAFAVFGIVLALAGAVLLALGRRPGAVLLDEDDSEEGEG